MGLANYYSQYVCNFATLAAPLTDLLQRTKAFLWGPEQQHSFEAIKVALTSAPCLELPRFDLPFELVTDASNVGIGAVLQQ